MLCPNQIINLKEIVFELENAVYQQNRRSGETAKRGTGDGEPENLICIKEKHKKNAPLCRF